MLAWAYTSAPLQHPTTAPGLGSKIQSSHKGAAEVHTTGCKTLMQVQGDLTILHALRSLSTRLQAVLEGTAAPRVWHLARPPCQCTPFNQVLQMLVTATLEISLTELCKQKLPQCQDAHGMWLPAGAHIV